MVTPPLITILRFLLVCSLGLTVGKAQTAPADTDAIRKKLERIIIPKIDFREATIVEATEFLKKESAELDKDSPVGERGVAIEFKLVADKEAATGKDPEEPRITVSLTNIPLIEALKYVAGISNLKLQIAPHFVAIVSPQLFKEPLVTKEWKIPKGLIPGVDKLEGKIAEREMVKNWLISNGVTFEANAAAVYIVKSSRLIVRNTQDQVDLVDVIIASSQEGVGPPAMEIECRLVEIPQGQIESSYFDELKALNHPNVFVSGPDVGTSPQTPAITAGSVSGGVRSISADMISQFIVPGAASVSGVFTDPQFQVIQRALKDHMHATVFSLPVVTVKSGQPAVIEFIRQFRNPQEELPPQVRSLPSTAIEGLPITPGLPLSPQRDRNISVAIEVSPVVGPDGYTIDVDIHSQVSEFEGFVGYGSPFAWKNPALRQVGDIITPHPTFHPLYQTPKAKTTVSIYDGSTVFFNDLLSGAVAKDVSDKDLLVTKIPILSENDWGNETTHDRRRLMLFMTTRLKTASSEPVRAADEKEELIDPTTPPEKAPEKLPLMPR